MDHKLVHSLLKNQLHNLQCDQAQSYKKNDHEIQIVVYVVCVSVVWRGALWEGTLWEGTGGREQAWDVTSQRFGLGASKDHRDTMFVTYITYYVTEKMI